MKHLLSTVTLALVVCAGFLTSAPALGQIEEDPTQLLQLNTITTAVPFLMIALILAQEPWAMWVWP